MKYTIPLFALAVFCILMTCGMPYASAQVYDKTYAKSLVLAGTGSSTTATVTLAAPTLTAPYSFILPATEVANGFLTNDGSGNLSWVVTNPVYSYGAGSPNQFITSNGTTTSWTTLNVDGTTLTGKGISPTPLEIDLPHANTWTVAQDVSETSTLAAPVDALVLSNTTAATSSLQQWSPRLHMHGQGWGGTNEPVDWIMQLIPFTSSSSTDSSYLDISDNQDNGGYASDFDLYASGGATLGITTPKDPGAGVLNVATGFKINGTGTTGYILEGNGTAYVPTSTAFPSTSGSAGQVLQSNGTSFTNATVNVGQFTPSNPASTTSTSAVMMGLGGTATITPGGSGLFFIIISGSVLNTSGTSPNQSSLQLRYGTTFPAPGNGVTATGTTLGAAQLQESHNNVNQFPFSLSGIITTKQTAKIWIDMSVQNTDGSGPVTISNVSISVYEL